MLNFFKKIFRLIFGGSEEPAKTQEPGKPVVNPPKKEEKKEEKPTPSGEGVTVEIKRSNYGSQDTIGKFFLNGEFKSYSLESPKDTCIPEGSYPLSLRKEGGKHSTYWYRFGDMHKGMLRIGGDDLKNYPCISIGNVVDETKGSILVGTELKGEDESQREVWYSTQAYKAVYVPISEALEEGKEVTITIISS